MIAFPIEILELPNFGHMTTSTVWLKLHEKIVDDDIAKNYDVITFIVKYLYFKKDWSSQFWLPNL